MHIHIGISCLIPAINHCSCRLANVVSQEANVWVTFTINSLLFACLPHHKASNYKVLASQPIFLFGSYAHACPKGVPVSGAETEWSEGASQQKHHHGEHVVSKDGCSKHKWWSASVIEYNGLKSYFVVVSDGRVWKYTWTTIMRHTNPMMPTYTLNKCILHLFLW